jgi:hypothetical protein
VNYTLAWDIIPQLFAFTTSEINLFISCARMVFSAPLRGPAFSDVKYAHTENAENNTKVSTLHSPT